MLIYVCICVYVYILFLYIRCVYVRMYATTHNVYMKNNGGVCVILYNEYVV